MVFDVILSELFIIAVIGLLYYTTIRPKIEDLELKIESQDKIIQQLDERIRWFENKLIEAGVKGRVD